MGGTAREWVLRVVLGRDPEVVERGPSDPELHPDLVEINASLNRIRADQPGPTVVLAHHLAMLQRRGVRIHALRPAPVAHSARLVFADGTVVVINSQHPHDLPDLAVRLVRGERVQLTGVDTHDDAVRLELTTLRGPVAVAATGFDQAD